MYIKIQFIIYFQILLIYSIYNFFFTQITAISATCTYFLISRDKVSNFIVSREYNNLYNEICVNQAERYTVRDDI